jgi:hypothetical protein
MGVKYGRAYNDIIRELTEAIGKLDEIYTSFEMTQEEWQAMDGGEQMDCLRTMSDDIFYGLGTEPVLPLGRGRISHDPEKHILKISDGDKLVSLVYLI